MAARSDPKLRVTHEARGRSQDGSVQEAVEGEEADPRGVHPAVPAPPAAHPPHQREYQVTEEQQSLWLLMSMLFSYKNLQTRLPNLLLEHVD